MPGIDLFAERTPKRRRTWTLAAIPLTVLFLFIGQSPGAIAMLMLHMPLDAGVDWRSDVLLLLTFAPITVVFLLWNWLFERAGPATLGFNAHAVTRYTRGLLIGLGFAAAAVGGVWLLGGYRFEGFGAWEHPTVMTFVPIAAVFFGFVAQGAAEEVAMRGYLMQVIVSRHGIYWGIGISMILFSLLHASNIAPSKQLFMGLINIVLVGVFFSLYAILERSLWGVCAWHSAWNFLLGAGFGLEVSGQKVDVSPFLVDLQRAPAPWWITGGQFGPEGSVMTSVVLLIGIGYLIRRGALKPKPADPVGPPMQRNAR
jgi:membrane protease YdiL (CAAX protease family)